jgi:Tol biopolymer transport system component
MRQTISRRTFLAGLALAGCSTKAKSKRKEVLIGYTEYQTNLPTRFANQVTARAYVTDLKGRHRHEIAPDLIKEPYAWTQFAGWSPDGDFAIVGRGWEDPENGKWEEAHKTFRMTEGWLFDNYLVDLKKGHAENLTGVERISSYNSGLFFVPGGKLGFTALIDGVSHPYVMDRDGRNKKDLTKDSKGFAYGFSASPDGAMVAYHKDYKIYVASADGTHERRIETGNEFNFAPQWSPDGGWLMFVSGEHYNCHPYVVRPDGTGLRKLADRNGYEGWISVYDVYDFHNGSSDVPMWSVDGKWVYYTANSGDAIELFRVRVQDGAPEQLTHSHAGARHYHPKPSPDGQWLAFGSNKTGIRQLYVMATDGRGSVHAVTDVAPHHGAMWAYWRP